MEGATLYTTLYTLCSSQWRGQDFKSGWWVQMKILMVTPSYKSRSRPFMKTRSLERTPPKKNWICPLVGVIFQANSLLFYWLSKSRGPRFLSRNTANSRFLSLVSCDRKQISNMLDLKTQSLAIKVVSLKLPHTADFLD